MQTRLAAIVAGHLRLHSHMMPSPTGSICQNRSLKTAVSCTDFVRNPAAVGFCPHSALNRAALNVVSRPSCPPVSQGLIVYGMASWVSCIRTDIMPLELSVVRTFGVFRGVV